MRAIPIVVLGSSLLVIDAARAADLYQVDGTHSMPTFTFNHLKLSSFRGRFDSVSGTVTLDRAQHGGNAEIVVDMNSVSTGVAQLDNFLKGPRFFDTARYPVATFKSSSFTFSGEQLVSLVGNLNLHGVTRPLALAVTFFSCREHPLLKVPSCGADAVATIKRSEFGLDAFADNDGDEVRLDVAIEVLQKP